MTCCNFDNEMEVAKDLDDLVDAYSKYFISMTVFKVFETILQLGCEINYKLLIRIVGSETKNGILIAFVSWVNCLKRHPSCHILLL
jgi:hypothetical protein